MLFLRNADKTPNMPQKMDVLCCFSCKMYQVHIVQKSKKWQCKICGEKQSIQAVYFKGSGSECRKQVQHLNGLKATEQDAQSFRVASIEEYGLDCVANDFDEIEPCACPSRAKHRAGKWEKYLQSDDDDDLLCEVPDDKENLSFSQENYQSPRKLQKRSEQSYSLPATQNFSIVQSDSNEWFNELKAGSSKSRTYPLNNNSRKMSGKWNYLDPRKEGFSGKPNTSQYEIPVSAPSQSHRKHNIFEDSDDDLDVTINF